MRFILNFIIFGIIYYIIYLFFPDAFHTLVSWADKTYEFFRDLVLQVAGKVRSEGTPSTTHQALLPILLWMKRIEK